MTLKALLERLYWHDWSLDDRAVRFRKEVCALFQALRDRQSRKAFCAPEVWLMTRIHLGAFEAELNSLGAETDDERAPRFGLSTSPYRARALLQDVPFCLAFRDRVRMFYGFIAQERKALEESARTFLPHFAVFSSLEPVQKRLCSILTKKGHKRSCTSSRRRRRERSTCASAASKCCWTASTRSTNTTGAPSLALKRFQLLVRSNLKKTVKVQFVDAHGNDEQGVDGGGLFKVRWCSLFCVFSTSSCR